MSDAAPVLYVMPSADAPAAAGCTWPALALAHLERVAAAGAPAAIIFDRAVPNPLAAARAVRASCPQVHFIFLRGPADIEPFRRALARAPMIGTHWTLLAAESTGAAELQAVVDEALRNASRRARLRTTLDRANLRLAAPRPADSATHRRLMLAEYYLNGFLAQAKDAMVGLNAELEIVHWNESAARLFGIDGTRALTLTLRDLPVWRPRVEAALARLRAGFDAPTEELSCAVGGAERQIEVAWSAVRDEHAELVGFMLVSRDATERHAELTRERAQRAATTEAIEAQRRLLSGLFDHAPGFMAVTRGPTHVFEMANRAYVELFGDRNLGERSIADTFPELAGQPFSRLRDEVYASGRPYVARAMPVRLKGRTGKRELRYLDLVYQPVHGADGAISGIFCQGHDVTEQKLMQEGLLHHQAELEMLVQTRTEALRSANLALQQSQKLEAVGKLTGGVAHDFNNILQVIAGNLELLGVEYGADTAAMKRVASAMGAVERGGKLAAQLLAFARRQPLQPVPTDMTGIVQGMEDMLRRALGQAVEIDLRIAPGLWSTLVDRDQLENVLLNLSINARDAMADGGKLTIELENALLDGLYLHDYPDVGAGSYVLLAVSDTGCGMSEDVRQRAFEPFYTTKPEGEGTGLGLSMAYGFVKQSGGHIKIYSEAGVGTTVKIFLPRCDQQAVPAAAPRVGLLRGGSETILVVEDDAAVQAAVVDILSGLGYTVLAASEAQGALSILEAGAAVDLLFTDVVMPGALRSPELARIAQRLQPSIGVLFTSGYTRNAIMQGARLDPGVALLSKPYRRDELARRVREVLDARPVAAPQPDGARRVLAVEDNDDGREMLAELLRMLGYEVAACASAEEALGQLRQGDVLLTDVTLPGMSGIELARLALQRFPGMAIVFASGYDVGALPGIAHQLLPKPFSLERLQEVMERAR